MIEIKMIVADASNLKLFFFLIQNGERPYDCLGLNNDMKH